MLHESESCESLAGTMLFLWAVSDTSDKEKEEAVPFYDTTRQSKRRNRCGKMQSIGRGDHAGSHRFMRLFKEISGCVRCISKNKSHIPRIKSAFSQVTAQTSRQILIKFGIVCMNKILSTRGLVLVYFECYVLEDMSL